jgi:hypothetical protein
MKLGAVTAAMQEIEREATGTGILQPGAAYALGVLAEALDVQRGETGADLAARLAAPASWLDVARAEGLDCRYRGTDGTPDEEA